VRSARRAGGGARPGASRAATAAAVLGRVKLRVLREADACSRPGEVGALLRREGLYTSHLSQWRKQRDQGALRALSRPRGRPGPHPLETENAELRQRAAGSEAELAKARKVIEVQGNVSALLGELLEPRGAKRSTER